MKTIFVLSMGFFLLALPLCAQTVSSELSNFTGDPSLVRVDITQPLAPDTIKFDLSVSTEPGLKGGSGDIRSAKFFVDDPGDAPLSDHLLREADPQFDSVFAARVTSVGLENGEREGSSKLLASVPEPATMLLLGGGLIGLAVIGRKKLFKKK